MHKKQNENLKRIYIQEEIGSMICSSRIVSKIGSTRRLSGVHNALFSYFQVHGIELEK